MNDYENIDKSKFQFVHQDGIKISDEEFQSKRIGFYQDAWIRFRRNKVSLFAFAIICIILLFTFIGPHMKKYDLPQRHPDIAMGLQYLPPKIKGLEKLGIFDGSREVELDSSYVATLPKEIVKKIKSTHMVGSTERSIIIVDQYLFINYQRSYDNGTRDEQGNVVVPTINLNKEQYEQALEDGLIIQLVNYSNGSYRVQIKYFEYVFGTTADNVYFWFGTEEMGRDLFTLIWSGSRVSILMAVSIMVINMVIGVVLGSIAGYYGGKVDIIFDRVVEVLSGIPFIGLLSIMVLRFGPKTGIVILAFTMTGWISVYATTRAQTYRYKNREYVLAARTLGASDYRIVSKHILPNALGTLITSFALMIPSFIFTESTYSFLGIINYSNATSIGRLISDGQSVMQYYPHALLFPAIYISLLMVAFNLFSNGLRDAFNPSLRGVEE